MDRQEKGIKKINKSSSESSFIMKPKKKISKKWLIIPAVFLIITALFIYIRHDNSTIKVTKVTVSDEDLPAGFDGFRILVLSDFYGKIFGPGNSKLIDAVNSVDYDIIVMTGDFLNEAGEQDGLEGIGLLLSGRADTEAPVYFVLGDNDADISREELSKKSESWFRTVDDGDDNQVKLYLEQAGAHYVYPMQMIEKDGDRIFLTGLRYYEQIFDSFDFDSDRDYSISVTHKPVNYDVDKRLDSINRNSFNEVDFDFVISGSTIGGVCRLPVLGALYTKEYGMLPQESYIYGLHSSQGRYSFITSGLGTPKGKTRFFNGPEIALIELRCASHD